MNRVRFAGHVKQLRGRLMQAYGRLLGDPILTGRGTALVVAGSVQVTCGKATRVWAHAMRDIARRA